MRKPILATLAVLIALPLAAQNTDIESLSGLQFNFGNPGARSLGMGGAFLGLADDASAAEANPAGLTILRRPEVSIEARNSLTTQTFNVGGTFPDLVSEDFNSYSRRAEVTFASVVYPVGNFAVAGYYHLPLRFENNIDNLFGTDSINFYLGENGPVDEQTCANDPNCLEYELFPFFTAVNIDLQTWGLATAYKAGNFSIGVAARYQEFEEGAFTFRTDLNDNPLAAVAQVSEDDDITYSAGFKWQMGNRFSIGGVYKEGAQFEAPLLFADLQQGGGFEEVARPTFHVPDVYGVGISLRPVPVLTINVDAVNVNYSNLSDDFVSIYNGIDGDVDYETEDVTEIHAGAEYFFTLGIPVAIRAGWWRDPAHQLEFVGAMTEPNRVSARILYPGSEDQDHYTVGIGLAWPRFQIDAAYDTSDDYKVGSISMVTRF
jgi:long-chain fatty acid transport protein